jgi:hypothetical protein
MVRVNVGLSDPPTPRSRARARAVQRREQERAALRNMRRRERREQTSEEFRLREQQGLSSPGTEEYSSSGEEEEEEGEEEEDRGQVLPDRWEPAPPSPELAPMARESSPGAGAGAPAARRSTAEAVYSGVGGDLVEEEASLLLLEVRSCLSRGHVLDRRGFDTWLSCLQGDANCAPLAPAKVLRADASVPTRQRSSRATRAAVSMTATASGGSQDASEASRPRLVTSTTEPQQTVVEARRRRGRWRRHSQRR